MTDNRYYEKRGGNDYPFAPRYSMPSSSKSVWVKAEFVLMPMARRSPNGDHFLYLDIDSIDNERQRIREPKRTLTTQAPSRAARAVFSSSTLFSMVRPYLRNIAYVGEENQQCIASTGFFVATPIVSLFNPVFLYYVFTSDYVVNGLNKYMKGDNSPSISADDVKSFALPLFSMAYQNRCVSFIKRMYCLLEQIDRSQKTLIELSHILRAKVLSSVFSSDKSYYRPLSEIGAIVGGGTPKTDTPEYWGGDIAWIGPADMGKYKEKYIKTVSRYITAEGLAHSGAVLMPKGSVIMSSRAPIGYLGIATCPICTSQGCKSVVPHDIRDSEYIYYALSALVDKLKNVGKGTTFNEISGKVLARQSISWPKQEDRKKAVCLMTALNEIIRSLTTNS